jgi:hypothetical protein
MPRMVEQTARTADGQWRVFLHEDQTAELADHRGRLCLGRVPLHRIGIYLAELGYDVGDLIRE